MGKIGNCLRLRRHPEHRPRLKVPISRPIIRQRPEKVAEGQDFPANWSGFMEERLAPKRNFYLVCLTLISFGLVASRRPDALFHPQFFAEDGVIFYQQAFNTGWLKALETPVAGYYDTISRLVAAVSMAFPIWAAPPIFNVAAIAIQISPVWFFNTSRFDGLIP